MIQMLEVVFAKGDNRSNISSFFLNLCFLGHTLYKRLILLTSSVNNEVHEAEISVFVIAAFCRSYRIRSTIEYSRCCYLCSKKWKEMIPLAIDKYCSNNTQNKNGGNIDYRTKILVYIFTPYL